MKTMLTFVLILLINFVPSSVFAKQKILIIESYHSEYRWDQSYIEGLKSVFQHNYELFYFQIDSKRLLLEKQLIQVDKAWLKYQELQPDLVILGDDYALKHLGKRFIKTTTPIVYLGINDNPRKYNVHNSKNFTGVLERPLIKRSISSIAYGNAKKVLLISDNSLTSQAFIKETFSDKKRVIFSNLNVDIKIIAEWDKWQEQILKSAEQQYDIVFIGKYHTLIDQDNHHISAAKALEWTIQNTPIPPFAFWDFSIGKDKAIGGLVMFGFDQGKLAAQMAMKILEEGIPPYELSVKTAKKGSFLFSKEQLKRFSIKLPEHLTKNATFVD